MTKQLEMTDTLRARIAAAVGADVPTTDLVAFEAVAFNTLPVSKKGSIFDGSRADVSYLHEMASAIIPSGGIPLHNLHMQGAELPIGKVFYGQVLNNELRVQFYLSKKTDQSLIDKLNAGIVDENSVGIRSKQLLCNQCGFDYMGPDALMNLFSQTCPNDHVIGENGTHLQLKGLDRWMELSLVSMGAATRPKIVGRTKALLGADEFNKLNANGVSPDVTTLFGSATKDRAMEKELLAQLSTLSVEKGTLTAQLAASTADVTRLTAELATANTKIADLTKTADADKTGLQTQLDAANAVIKTQVEFLTGQLKAANVALGKTVEDKDLPTDLAKLTAALTEATESVHKLFPKGGVSTLATQTQSPASVVDISAFRVNK